MASIPHPRPEDLLAQSGWMRELALSLLGDPAAADDVVQETWIAALKHPPLGDRPLEPWLARVVRNFAWKRRRREARRALHENDAPRGEPVPGPEATAERLELQRTVLAAVEGIAEPFRTAVVERYLQGRSSADIARALGVPEGTVRWRLKRGLDELRQRLDARFGQREAWSALLLPLALSPNTPLSPNTSSPNPGVAPAPGPLERLALEPGVLTMIGASKIVLALTLGAAAVGYLLWRDGEVARGGKEAPVLAVAAPVELPTGPRDTAVAPLERAEQREPQAAAPPVSAPQAVPAPALEPESELPQALLRMRFVDAQGAPWKGVEVIPRGSESVDATSGPDGRAELKSTGHEDWGEWPLELLARRDGCETRLLRIVAIAGRTTDLGDVLLEPGSRVEGRCLDTDGLAFAGAEVGLASENPFEEEMRGDGEQTLDEGLVRRQGASGFDRSLSTQSDADGAFTLAGIAPGRWRLWAHAPGMRFGWTEPFEVLAGENLFGLEVRLPALLATDRITGIVLDPEGKPLPSARLLSSYEIEHESSSSSQDVGLDGRFDVVLRRDAVYAFIASDPEHRYADAIVTDVAPGTRDLELRLSARRPFEIAVHDREGQAIEGCRFVLGTRVAGAEVEDSSAPVPIEAGLYGLARPALPFRLQVEADGYLPARFEDLRPETVGARFEVVLAPAPRLRGRVLAEGRPLAHARVSLHRAIVDEGHWRDGFACLYEPRDVSEDTSDAEGRFELTCADSGRVWLRAASPGWVTGDLGPLDPLVGSEVEIELTTGGSIEGRVLLPNGADGAGIVVGINHGDGRGRTQRAGPEGRFRFDHLAPGRWQVVRAEAELDPSSTTTMTSSQPVEIEWSCTVEAGRTTHHDLDLTRP